MNIVVQHEQEQEQQQQQQEQHEQEDPYSNFIDSLRSEQTKYKYAYHLKRYMEFLNIKDFTSLLLLSQDNNIKNIENSLIKYILYQRKKGYSYASITLALAAILHFYTMNDIVINRKKIGKYIGEYVKTIKDRAYTKEEIKKILDVCNLKYKVVVTLMASTGCRIGSIADLKRSNLVYFEKEKLYQIYFYTNTKEEYFSFCSYECAKYINEYLEYRKRCGETLTQKSPLIRDDFIQYDLDRIREPKHITLHALKFYLRDILLKTGIRISTPNDKKRKEVSANHGFRKYAHTTMANAKMNVEIREMLLGHTIGLSGAYYRPTETEMLEEYLKVIPDITIDQSHVLQKKVDQLEQQGDYSKYIEQKMKQYELELKQQKQENVTMREAVEEVFDNIKKFTTDLHNNKNHPLRKEIENIIGDRDEQQQKKMEKHKKLFMIRQEFDRRRDEIMLKKGFVTKEDEEAIENSVMDSIKESDPNLWKTLMLTKSK